MDGYTAFGASITYQGAKQTFLCPAPTAVLADLEVICAAPGLMNAWGYTDLLAKVTAGADWIVADALGIEPIDPPAWAIVQGRLREMVADPAGVAARNPEAVGRLVEGLMLGGFGMQSSRSSRRLPARNISSVICGHAASHNGKTLPTASKSASHAGVAALYEYLLAQPLDQLDAAWPAVRCGNVANARGNGWARGIGRRAAKECAPSTVR